MVRRVWQANGLHPHRTTKFVPTEYPEIANRMIQVVGLYLNPPEHAIVFRVKETGLPHNLGIQSMGEPDYVWNGVTTMHVYLKLSANILIQACTSFHRDREWIRFLKRIDGATDPAGEVHVVADNYTTPMHTSALLGLERHRRVHLHFIATRDDPWVRLAKLWLRELSHDALKWKHVQFLRRLLEAILARVENPYYWTKKERERPSRDTLARVRRARAILDKTKPM
jgi:hypothetical protein